MTLALQGAIVGLFAWVVFRLDERPRLAPDSAYYLAIGMGKHVPRPFCFRQYWPWLLSMATGRHWIWQLVTALAIVLQGVAMARLSGTWVGAALLLGLPAGARFAVRHPVLVDAPTLAVVLVVAVNWSTAPPSIWVAIIGGAVLTSMRENAGIWLVILTGQWWATAGILPALALGWLSKGRDASPGMGDNLWIVSPLGTSLRQRAGAWLSPGLMLLPWGVVLPLALLTPSWWLVGVLALGYAPIFLTSDTARVYHWAAPAVILVALQAPVPEWAWIFLLLAHWFNPYRGA